MREPAAQRRLACGRLAQPRRHNIAQHALIDQRGINACARDCGSHGCSAKIGCAQAAQATLESTDWCSCRAYDDNLFHAHTKKARAGTRGAVNNTSVCVRTARIQ
jgi:hypothetical protein